MTRLHWPDLDTQDLSLRLGPNSTMASKSRPELEPKPQQASPNCNFILVMICGLGLGQTKLCTPIALMLCRLWAQNPFLWEYKTDGRLLFAAFYKHLFCLGYHFFLIRIFHCRGRCLSGPGPTGKTLDKLHPSSVIFGWIDIFSYLEKNSNSLGDNWYIIQMDFLFWCIYTHWHLFLFSFKCHFN